MIGDVIRDKRKELGLTQAQLAERLGVTAPAVNRWEKGIGYPDVTLLAPLARLLNTDMNELFAFYQSLSETERSLLEKRAFTMLSEGQVSDALQFMDEQLRQNAADGQLYWTFAKTLMSFSFILKKTEPGFLDRTIDYYEKALELLPEATENIAEALVGLYGERCDREKAENVLALIPERKSDRKWSHAELMLKLGQYDDAASEAEESILRKAIELIPNFSFLYAALTKGGHDDLAQIAREKSAALQELFELWSGFDLINMLQDAELGIRGENDLNEVELPLTEILDVKTAHGGISKCPLFKDVTLGNAPKYEPSIADAMSDVMNALKKLDGQKQ